MTRCAVCHTDTLDAHQIEVCADCCACREDLASEVLAIATALGEALIPGPYPLPEADRKRLVGIALAVWQLAARLHRHAEAVSDG